MRTKCNLFIFKEVLLMSDAVNVTCAEKGPITEELLTRMDGYSVPPTISPHASSIF